MLNPNVNQIRTFIEVCELQSIKRASNRLNVSLSAISQQLNKLQDDLGCVLFNNERGKIVLTAAGRDFLKHSKAFIAKADLLSDWSNQQNENPDIKLKVICQNYDLYRLSILPFLKEFSLRYPNIFLEIKIFEQLIDISEYRADIYWGLGEYLGEDFPELTRRKLISFDYGVYASPDYIDEQGMPESPADLKDHRIIGRSDNIPQNGLFVRELRGQKSSAMKSVELEPSIIVTEGHIQLGLDGLGLFNAATIERGISHLVDSGLLVPVLEDYWYRKNSLYAYFSQSHRTKVGVDQFLKFFTDVRGDWDI